MKYIVDEKRLVQLLEAEELLNNLMAHGVDNWDGWYAWEEEEEDRDIKEDLQKFPEYKTT